MYVFLAYGPIFDKREFDRSLHGVFTEKRYAEHWLIGQEYDLDKCRIVEVPLHDDAIQ